MTCHDRPRILPRCRSLLIKPCQTHPQRRTPSSPSSRRSIGHPPAKQWMSEGLLAIGCHAFLRRPAARLEPPGFEQQSRLLKPYHTAPSAARVSFPSRQSSDVVFLSSAMVRYLFIMTVRPSSLNAEVQIAAWEAAPSPLLRTLLSASVKRLRSRSPSPGCLSRHPTRLM